MAARPGYVFHKGSMRGMVSKVFVLLWLLAVPAWPVLAADAPPAATSDLKVTVQDQTGAALIIASVTLVDATGAEQTVKVDDHGVATFTGLATGSVSAQGRGGVLPELRRSDHGQEGREPDHAQAAARRTERAGRRAQQRPTTCAATPSPASSRRRRSPSCPTTPTNCSRCSRQMAGPGATMRVNGFTGGRLPPKSQIRSIRFRMNSFDAEYHEGGGFGIDIVTKPGMDDWKGMSATSASATSR